MSNGERVIKKCSKCKINKPLNEFTKFLSRYDKLRSACKACIKKYRQTVKGKACDSKYQKSEKGKETYKKAVQKYHIANPIKRKARYVVTYAIVSGNLIKQPCQICGKMRVDAHHCDYRKPLEVMWLCRQHHVEWHKENGEGLNGK